MDSCMRGTGGMAHGCGGEELERATRCSNNLRTWRVCLCSVFAVTGV